MIDSNNNNTEVPEDLPEEQTSQSIVKNFAARSKAKAKPQKREPVELPSTIPMNERGLEESRKSSWALSKRYNEKTTEQFNSGESRVFFKINFHQSIIGRMIVGKSMAWFQSTTRTPMTTSMLA